MIEFFKAGGLMMIPILLCSVLALAIIAERLFVLRQRNVILPDLVLGIWEQVNRHQKLGEQQLEQLRSGSILGRILVAGFLHRQAGREVMKEHIEEAGRAAAHELSRFLNALGTIAAISPLLGLLGTVVGMIEVFSIITAAGIGNPTVLASGISKSLITTAAGLGVAIPALVFYRLLRARVEELVLRMEQEAIKLVAVFHDQSPAS